MHAENEAMVAFTRARQAVQEVRKARGYFNQPETTAQSSAERKQRLQELMQKHEVGAGSLAGFKAVLIRRFGTLTAAWRT